MRARLPLFWLLVAVTLGPGCSPKSGATGKPAEARPGRDFAADFRDCVKVEGMPTRVEHSAITKCLVDRFGWTIDQADRGADFIIQAFARTIDSIQAAVLDSIRRDTLAQRARELEARRDRWERQVTAAKTAWIGDLTTRMYYPTWPTCEAVKTIPPQDRQVFKSSNEADANGYRLNGYAGCGLAPPSWPGTISQDRRRQTADSAEADRQQAIMDSQAVDRARRQLQRTAPLRP